MLIENLKMALAALIANKMRSLLTMLGIIIGIGSVILTTSLGDTLRKAFSDIYSNLGVSQGFIYVNSEESRESDFFSLEDIARYKELFPDLVYIDAYDSASGEAKTRLGRAKLSLNGVDAGYEQLQPSIRLLYGRFLNTKDVSEEKTNCVIEDRTATALFGTENAVGRSFHTSFMKDMREFTVVGVYRQEMSAFEKLIRGVNPNTAHTVYTPWSLFKNEQSSMYMLRFFASPSLGAEALQEFNQEFLSYIARSKARADTDYVLESAQQQQEQTDQFLSVVSMIVGCIAAISLLVGGIGIMNIMLVSVTERTREIGTRKALGATTGDIMTQFLIESAVLSAVGGMIGVGFAVGIASLAGLLLDQTVVVRLPIILLAVGFSALVGIFFGIYPAKKAATCDPIVALRYE
ncbi:MAG: ABC transporter permease [Stomatobaculum sp.]